MPGALFAFCLMAGCGHAPKGDRVVLVDTQKDEVNRDSEAIPEQTEGLKDRIQKDERRAAETIRNAIGDKDKELAAWAAVYALRLKIQHDEELSLKALARGVTVKNSLLAALCWRWLASQHPKQFPRWHGGQSADPIVKAMAALALARRGQLPRGLKSALGLPSGQPRGPNSKDLARDRVERLLALTAPFDNGPLALAIVFVEARRREWVEQSANLKTVWVSERLRNELIQLTMGDDPTATKRIHDSKNPRGSGFTELSQQFETSLVRHPRQMLHTAAMTGDSDLRKEALRAIAVTASEPVSGDFGAAAAALDVEDPVVRLEGARTFLLLSSRAHSIKY
ncbi:MAG: hypothetical protein GY847_40360 [Proteobacteria bacterium]|nr:hypothetical protein [Pseudomonadota bacterium]